MKYPHYRPWLINLDIRISTSYGMRSRCFSTRQAVCAATTLLLTHLITSLPRYQFFLSSRRRLSPINTTAAAEYIVMSSPSSQSAAAAKSKSAEQQSGDSGVSSSASSSMAAAAAAVMPSDLNNNNAASPSSTTTMAVVAAADGHQQSTAAGEKAGESMNQSAVYLQHYCRHARPRLYSISIDHVDDDHRCKLFAMVI